jgi:hypothetical protein
VAVRDCGVSGVMVLSRAGGLMTRSRMEQPTETEAQARARLLREEDRSDEAYDRRRDDGEYDEPE